MLCLLVCHSFITKTLDVHSLLTTDVHIWCHKKWRHHLSNSPFLVESISKGIILWNFNKMWHDLCVLFNFINYLLNDPRIDHQGDQRWGGHGGYRGHHLSDVAPDKMINKYYYDWIWMEVCVKSWVVEKICLYDIALLSATWTDVCLSLCMYVCRSDIYFIKDIEWHI